jgi:hypothetical protein
MKRAAKADGRLPWSGVERLELKVRGVVASLDVWRKKKRPA